MIYWPNVGATGNEDAKLQDWLRWMTRGPWDVDNDGDGIMDSVWTDLNLPLITSREGKLLKALIAFYIEDMDSKLDINATGNNSQVNDAASGQTMSSNKYAMKFANQANPNQWPQGTGYGTAEISQRPLYGTSTEYNEMLMGKLGRYASADSTDTVPGQTTNDVASTILERNRADSPSNFGSPAPLVGYPQSQFPMAVQGKSGLGLDLLGNPILVEAGTINETTNDPYEFRILSAGQSDRPIKINDYERLIRYNDLDRSSLPRRLEFMGTSFTPTATGYTDRVRSISPRNVHLSLPTFPLNFSNPRYTGQGGNVTNQSRRVSSFVQFVEAYAKNKKPDISASIPNRYFPNAALKRLFPIEFMQNRPLDLNRPLGDGKDSNSDGVIDDADESFQAAIYSPASSIIDEYARDTSAELIPRPFPAPNPYPFRPYYDPDLEIAPAALRTRYTGNQAKQLLARHLYCLAQLILPAHHRFSNHYADATLVKTAPNTDLPTPAERARILAQWAVNVVDFRDADSACTRFAYDANPFELNNTADGPVYWAPGNDPVNDGVVWGLEQPELVLTEALAFHNLNVRRDPGNPNNYQQLRTPQGSMFLELLATRTTAVLVVMLPCPQPSEACTH